jgi:hypothetical protein
LRDVDAALAASTEEEAPEDGDEFAGVFIIKGSIDDDDDDTETPAASDQAGD